MFSNKAKRTVPRARNETPPRDHTLTFRSLVPIILYLFFMAGIKDERVLCQGDRNIDEGTMSMFL